MIRNIIILFFIFFKTASFATCLNKGILKFQLKDQENMSAKNCIDPKNPIVRLDVKTKPKFCKCVKSNVDKLEPSSIKIEDKDLKIKVDAALSKAQIALLSLSEELFLMNNDTNLQNLELGPKCNANHHLKERIVKCNGKDNLVFDESERQSRLNKIYSQLSIDSRLDSPRNYPKKDFNSVYSPAALYSRKNMNKLRNNKCMIDSPVSQKLISDIQKRMLPFQFKLLFKFYQENSTLDKNIDTFEKLLNSVNQGDQNTSKSNNLIRAQLLSNPVLKHSLKSEGLFTAIKQNPSNIDKILEEYTNIDVNQSEIIKSTQDKCDATFKAIETAICSSKEDNFLPSTKEKSPTPLRRYLSEKYDTENQSDLLESSYISYKNYCIENDKKENIFDKVSSTANLVNQYTLKGIDSFDEASGNIYKKTTFKDGEFLCDHMPPGMDKLENKLKIEGCNNEDKEGVVISANCMMLKATYNLLKPTYDMKIEETRAIAIESARESGVTDEAKLNEIADKAQGALGKNDIIAAYSDYNSPKEETALMRSFLGIKEVPKSDNQNSNNIAKRGSLNSNGTSRSGNRNIIQDIDGTSEQDLAQRVEPQTPAQRVQQQTAQNMDNFYKNVADRIVRRKNSPAKTRAKKGSSVTGSSPSLTPTSSFGSQASNTQTNFDEMSEFDRDEMEAAIAEEIGVDTGEIPRSESSLAARAPASNNPAPNTESNEARRVRERNEALNSLAGKLDNTIKMLGDGSIELPDLSDEEIDALLSEDPRLAENQLKQIKIIKDALKSKGEFVIVPKDKDFKVIVKKVDGKLKITSVLKKIGNKYVDIKNLQKSESFDKIKNKVVSFINNNNILNLLKKKESLYDELNNQITLK